MYNYCVYDVFKTAASSYRSTIFYAVLISYNDFYNFQLQLAYCFLISLNKTAKFPYTYVYK